MTSESLPAAGRLNRLRVIRRHRCKGRADRAYCTVNGERVWLGTFDSPESKERFDELTRRDEKDKPALIGISNFA